MNHSSISFYQSRLGVFTTAEKEIECNHGEISSGMLSMVPREICKAPCCFWYLHQYCHLWYHWRVLSPKTFNYTLGGKNVCFLTFVDRLTLSNQFAGLVDGRERIRDPSNFDLISATVSASPNPGSKGCEDDSLFTGWEACEGWICVALLAVPCPMLPIPLPSFESLYSDSICNCSPRKQDITYKANFSGTLNSSHDRSCGSGKVDLKNETISSWAWKNSPFLKALDGMLAMTLSLPVIFISSSDDACLMRCQMESKCSSLAAAMGVDALPLYAHATADVLSQNMPTCLNVRSATTCSRTSQPRTRPATHTAKPNIESLPHPYYSACSQFACICILQEIWILGDE